MRSLVQLKMVLYINIDFRRISVSFGNGVSEEMGIVNFGDDYFSDCSKLDIC